ncbi:MAG: acetate--CoA ligase family protein [Proteobacteria bacterium]|nr:acetate--CoA ligase family protein [Pseudomonadota bacterium]MBU1388998.1 acetate--CoA ligase family protein [Pseudomonadota bacterium]MBU1543550.1 acetate--CoA ligase family protein [Pseudomonadota bacterium]MBU2480648.1 acetate--CoA ligase family protein [Pseudomonadota bacterium]
MDTIRILIENAVQRGQKTLSEYDSKKVLASFNIPVSKEYLTTTVEEAVQKAQEIGFPVVLKVCSHHIAHKTEGGLVEISLGSTDAVKKAFERLMGEISEPIDGILVQEMVEGKRELMLGLIRDPQFGPCVMAGFGGIMTEIINDTCFRMAPVNNIEAADMLEEFKSKKMLEHFRGQAPVDRKALCDAICAIGAIGLEYDTISEIDINPLIIRPDGKFAAVDALVVLKGENDDQDN